MNSSEYKQALETTKQFLEELVGYSSHNATSSSDKQLLRQNNVIIYLLEFLLLKLDKINEKLEKLGKKPEDQAGINSLVDQFKKLDIGKPVRIQTPNQKKNIFGYRWIHL